MRPRITVLMLTMAASVFVVATPTAAFAPIPEEFPPEPPEEVCLEETIPRFLVCITILPDGSVAGIDIPDILLDIIVDYDNGGRLAGSVLDCIEEEDFREVIDCIRAVLESG